jgi:hypothetical protein
MPLKFVPDQVRGKSCRSTSQVRLKILNYRTLTYTVVAFFSCSWLGLINVYTFALDIFHLQYPSTIIQSSVRRQQNLDNFFKCLHVFAMKSVQNL